MSQPFEISHSEYRQFCNLLEDNCGIELGTDRQYLVASRLRNLMGEHGFTCFHQLLLHVRHDQQFAMQVVDAMTTNETLWFRDQYPYDIFRERILPTLWGMERPLRVWSSACSTGQEPYSLSMEVAHYRENNPHQWQEVNIVASDISHRVLNHARGGVYSTANLDRGMNHRNRRHHFEDLGNNEWKVNDDICQSIKFRHTNLTEDFKHMGKFDVIFCRNVLFYFNNKTRYDILMRMHNLLNTNGFLILGAADISFSVDEYFTKTSCHPGILYQARTLPMAM